MFKPTRCALAVLAAVATLAALGAGNAAQAAVRTWDGNGADDRFGFVDGTTGNTNWTDRGTLAQPLPRAGDSLVFAGTRRLAPVNDLSDLAISGISFAAGAGAFAVTGERLVLGGDIHNLSGQAQLLKLDIDLSASQTWHGHGAELKVTGRVRTGSFALALDGGAVLDMLGFTLDLRRQGDVRVLAGGGTVQADSLSAFGGAIVHASGPGALLSFGDVALGTGTGGASSTVPAVVTVQGGARARWGDTSLGVLERASLVAAGPGTAVDTGTLRLENSSRSVGGGAGNAAFATVSVTGGAVLRSARGEVGACTGNLCTGFGDVVVSGPGSQWQVGGTLDIGQGTQAAGQLTILDGGVVRSGEAWVAAAGDGAYGLVVIANSGSAWRVDGALHIGGGSPSDATVSVDPGGLLHVGGSLALGAGGRLALQGGELRLDQASAYLGLLDKPGWSWSSGTVTVPTLAVAAGSSALASLGAGRTMQVQGTAQLAVGAVGWLNGGMLTAQRLDHGGVLVLGDGTLRVGTLALNGGVISGTPLAMDGIGAVEGHGLINAALRGGTAANTVRAQGGSLVLGQADADDGFRFGGVLDAGNQRVVLLDRDGAELGVLTRLAAGGRLASDSGLLLAGGSELRASGAASVHGAFHNAGRVVAEAGAVLTFEDDVSGPGAWQGDIVFADGFATGPVAMAIGFGGGKVAFDASSLLTLHVRAQGGAWVADSLVDIDRLSFAGRLQLVFDTDPAAQGDIWLDLLDFQSFDGAFQTGQLSVAGLDAARVDGTRLGIDGRVHISAVPEPASVALWACGLALVAARGLGRRRER